MGAKLRIINLEDSQNDSELIKETLAAEESNGEVIRVETQEEFLTAIEQGGIDLILADYSLPGFDGLSALALASECCPDVPFIFVTGTMGEEIAVESLKQGATDYVLKQNLGRLAPVVRRALKEAQERRDHKQAEMALWESKVRLQAIFTHSPIAIALIDTQGKPVFSNPALESIMGYDAKELALRSFQF